MERQRVLSGEAVFLYNRTTDEWLGVTQHEFSAAHGEARDFPTIVKDPSEAAPYIVVGENEEVTDGELQETVHIKHPVTNQILTSPSHDHLFYRAHFDTVSAGWKIGQQQDQLEYGEPLRLLHGVSLVHLVSNGSYITTSMNSAQQDEWVLVPSGPVYQCVHNLCIASFGNDIPVQGYHCKDGRCTDNHGNLWFQSDMQCFEKCTVASYACSGPPLYRCTILPPTQLVDAAQSFETCHSTCKPPITQAPVPTTNISNGLAVFLAMIVAIVVVGVIVVVSKKIHQG